MWACCKLAGAPVAVAVAAVLLKAWVTPPLGELAPVDLRGRTYIVTGPTAGLGSWHVEQLAAWNATLVLPVRNLKKGNELADRLAREYPGAPRPLVEELDLSSLASVRAFAERYKGPVDVLVHNAAVLGTGEVRRTEDGYEECFQVNYLASVLLTQLLVDRVEQSPAGRVVFVSAKAHESANVSTRAMREHKVLDPGFVSRQGITLGNLYGSYADSKLAQILFSAALNRRLRGPAVSMSLHPAITQTEIRRVPAWRRALEAATIARVGRLVGLMQTREDAPKTQIHVSTHPALQEGGGRYYSALSPPLVNCGRPAVECGVSQVSELAANKGLQEDVFKASCELLGLADGLCARPIREDRGGRQ